MKDRLRRVLALVLSFMMLFSNLPVSAIAEGIAEAAQQNANNTQAPAEEADAGEEPALTGDSSVSEVGNEADTEDDVQISPPYQLGVTPIAARGDVTVTVKIGYNLGVDGPSGKQTGGNNNEGSYSDTTLENLQVGDYLRFWVNIKNNTTSQLSNLKLSIQVSAAGTLLDGNALSSTSSPLQLKSENGVLGGVDKGKTLTAPQVFSLASKATGSARSIRDYKIEKGGEYTYTVTVTDENDTIIGSDSVTAIVPGDDIEVKTEYSVDGGSSWTDAATEMFVEQDKDVMFKVTVENNGTDAHTVRVDDVFTVNGTEDSTITETSLKANSLPEGASYRGGVLIVPARTSIELISKPYTVKAYSGSYDLKNTVKVTDEEGRETEISVVLLLKHAGAAFTVTNEYSVNGGEYRPGTGTIKPGDTASYRITVENTGRKDLTLDVMDDVFNVFGEVEVDPDDEKNTDKEQRLKKELSDKISFTASSGNWTQSGGEGKYGQLSIPVGGKAVLTTQTYNEFSDLQKSDVVRNTVVVADNSENKELYVSEADSRVESTAELVNIDTDKSLYFGYSMAIDGAHFDATPIPQVWVNDAARKDNAKTLKNAWRLADGIIIFDNGITNDGKTDPGIVHAQKYAHMQTYNANDTSDPIKVTNVIPSGPEGYLFLSWFDKAQVPSTVNSSSDLDAAFIPRGSTIEKHPGKDPYTIDGLWSHMTTKDKVVIYNGTPQSIEMPILSIDCERSNDVYKRAISQIQNRIRQDMTITCEV